MSDLRIDTTNIIGDLIPDVYIDNVILEASGPDLAQPGNPHATPGAGRRNPVTGEVLDAGDEARTPSSLKVSITALLKDSIEDNIVSSWFEQQDFHKYLKVVIMASTSDQISNVIFRADADKNMARMIFGLVERGRGANLQRAISGWLTSAGYNDPVESTIEHIEKNLFYESFETLSQHQLGEYEEEQDQDGNIIRNINISASFTIPGRVNPKHLNIFAFTYLDLDSLLNNFGDLDFGDAASLQFTTGRLVVQSVISDSQIVRSAVFFRTAAGAVWPGPVHEMSPGVWMGGRYHIEGAEQPTLERVVIPNTTVQDFRITSDMNKHQIDFTFFEQNTFPAFNKIFRERVKDNLDQDKSSYFSDLFLARGVTDAASMFFSFNAGKFIKENTRYPMLLEQRPSLVSSQYLIQSFKVVRRRVKKPEKFKNEIIGFEVNPDNILEFDRNLPIETVVSVEETSPGWIPQQFGERTRNSIREVRTDREKLIRTFSVSDQQVRTYTDGYYQYGVEIEIRDLLNEYLNRQISTLSQYRDELYRYFVEATQPTGRFSDSSISVRNPHVYLPATDTVSLGRVNQKGNYDQRTNRFTQKFIEKMDRRYADKPEEKPWIKVMAKLSNFLSLFTTPASGSGGLGGTSWRRDLWTMCSPKTGSPDGILTILKLIDSVVDQIQKLIGVTTSATTSTSIGSTSINDLNTDASTAASAKPKKDVYKIQYWFTNSIFDSNLLKQTGFHYLAEDPGDLESSRRQTRFAGLRTIGRTKFKDRIKKETLRYFNTENPDVAPEDSSVNPALVRTLSKTDISDYSYLAPSIIQPTARNPISLFGSVSALHLVAGVSDILNIKSPPNEPKRIPLPSAQRKRQPNEERSSRYSQIVRDNLTEVLADRGCTVELPLRTVGLRTPTQIRTESIDSRPDDSAVLRGLPSIGGILTPEDIRDSAGASNRRIGNYLGSSPSVVGQFSPEVESTVEITTPRNEDALNSGLLFLRIMYNTILENQGVARLSRLLSLLDLRDRLSLSNFHLHNPNNAIERLNLVITGGDPLARRYSFVPQLPNQIKSLFLASDSSGKNAVKDGTIFENVNALSDPVNAMPIFLKYLNLSRIEVLTGFEKVTQPVYAPTSDIGDPHVNAPTRNTRQTTETQLKSPTWELLTRGRFDEFVSQRTEMICRLRPYRNSAMKIEALQGIQLPVYDGYFIIQPEDPANMRLNVPETDTASINQLIALENTNRITRREYISTDPRLNIGGRPGAIGLEPSRRIRSNQGSVLSGTDLSGIGGQDYGE